MKSENRAPLVPAVAGLLASLLQLATARDGYGIFRDELYYVANGRHLDFGYVDHPALIGWISWLTTALFGESQLALRILPAIAAGVTVYLASRMVQVMEGGRFAQILTAIAVGLAPIYVGLFGYLSMNAFDVLFWAACVLIAAKLLRTGDLRLWIPFGIVAGIGLENKISVLFLGFGLVAGLILNRDWRHFRSRWLWIGGAIACLLFLPYLLWQATHDWATVEFMRRATQFKNVPLSPIEFARAQVLMMNPVALPLALAGLGFYLFAGGGRPFRALGWACVAIFVLMVVQRAKPYYYTPTFTMLFAGGSVALERWLSRGARRRLRPLYPGLLALSGLALAPLAKPVLPVETFVRYQAALGLEPSTDERHDLGRLPQFFADRLGWQELALTVAAVYDSLPPADRSETCIFGQNYGQAGAIDYFGPSLGLPPAISGHNSYWWWGPGSCGGEVVIVIGGDREDLERVFTEVVLATTYTCRDCMPYEDDKPIWVGRGPTLTLEELWPQLRHYD